MLPSWCRNIAKIFAMAFGAALIVVALPSSSRAQYSFDDIYPDFFKIPEHGQLSTLGFTG